MRPCGDHRCCWRAVAAVDVQPGEGKELAGRGVGIVDVHEDTCMCMCMCMCRGHVHVHGIVDVHEHTESASIARHHGARAGRVLAMPAAAARLEPPAPFLPVVFDAARLIAMVFTPRRGLKGS